MKQTLQEIGMKHRTDKATFHKFCDFYEENLPKNPKRLLEIGIMDGASLRMWHEYYPDTEIIGLDIRPPLNIKGVTCLQLDATKVENLESLGKFDIIIDDGSHMTADQQASFDYLFENSLTDDGIFVMEDLHTSFMPNYVNTPETTYDLLKKRSDALFWSRTDDLSESVTALVWKVAQSPKRV